MANRHLGRTIAMQTLYEWDFNKQPTDKIASHLQHNLDEFAPQFDDVSFVKGIIDGVLENLQAVDKTITDYAPEWPLEQITIIDRNILRIGVFELVFSESIPSKVAINEAIEVAKTFGGESSGRFVNGVLGAIYRDRVSEGKLKKIDLQEQKPKGGDKKEKGKK